MRMLYLPMWSNSRSLSRCSTWHWASRFFPYLVRAHDDLFVYFCVPRAHSREIVAEIAHPRILFIPTRTYRDQYREMLLIPEQVLDLFDDGPQGRYYVDAVVCDKVLGLQYARAVVRCYIRGSSRSPVWVATPQFLIDRHLEVMPPEYREVQASGLASADLSLWATLNHRSRGIEAVKRWAGLAAADRVRRHSSVGLWGVDLKRISRVTRGIERPRDVVIVHWAYGMTKAYRMVEIFRAVRNSIAIQNRLQALVTSASKGATMLESSIYDMGETHLGLSQDEFWRKAARAHVFVFGPERNELNFSVLEQQWLGQVGIFLDRKMNKAQLYPDYPYLAQSWDEVPGMLIHLVQHWWDDEVQSVISRQKAFIRANYQIDDVAERFYDRVCRLWQERITTAWEGRKGSIRQLYREKLAKYEVLPEAQWAELVQGLSEFGIGPHRSGRYEHGRSMWWDVMLLEGWADDCQEADPVFRRAKEGDEDLAD